MIPPVVASDRGRAQTDLVATPGRGSRTALLHVDRERNTVETVTVEGESPVCEARDGIAES